MSLTIIGEILQFQAEVMKSYLSLSGSILSGVRRDVLLSRVIHFNSPTSPHYARLNKKKT